MTGGEGRLQVEVLVDGGACCLPRGTLIKMTIPQRLPENNLAPPQLSASARVQMGREWHMATRRAFMKDGAMALVGTLAVPAFLRRSVLAQATSAATTGKKLVVIFQRGAADGLNIVVPYAETNYYRLRPTIAIPQNQVIELDGFFGLHPAMNLSNLFSIKATWL